MKKYFMAMMLALCVVGTAGAAESKEGGEKKEMTREEYGEFLRDLAQKTPAEDGEWFLALACKMNDRLMREGEDAVPPQIDFSFKR